MEKCILIRFTIPLFNQLLGSLCFCTKIGKNCQNHEMLLIRFTVSLFNQLLCSLCVFNILLIIRFPFIKIGLHKILGYSLATSLGYSLPLRRALWGGIFPKMGHFASVSYDIRNIRLRDTPTHPPTPFQTIYICDQFSLN